MRTEMYEVRNTLRINNIKQMMNSDGMLQRMVVNDSIQSYGEKLQVMLESYVGLHGNKEQRMEICRLIGYILQYESKTAEEFQVQKQATTILRNLCSFTEESAYPMLTGVLLADRLNILSSHVVSQVIKSGSTEQLISIGKLLLPLSEEYGIYILSIVEELLSRNDGNNFIVEVWELYTQGLMPIPEEMLSLIIRKSKWVALNASDIVLNAECDIASRLVKLCSQNSDVFQVMTEILHCKFIMLYCNMQSASSIASFIQKVKDANEDITDLYPIECQSIVTIFTIDLSVCSRTLTKQLTTQVLHFLQLLDKMSDEEWDRLISPLFTHFPHWYIHLVQHVCTCGGGGRFGKIVRRNAYTILGNSAIVLEKIKECSPV